MVSQTFFSIIVPKTCLLPVKRLLLKFVLIYIHVQLSFIITLYVTQCLISLVSSLSCLSIHPSTCLIPAVVPLQTFDNSNYIHPLQPIPQISLLTAH